MGIAAWLKNLFLHHKEPNLSELERAAEIKCLSVNDLDASGEYKRHLAYAHLIKLFPHERKHHISMAIEIAVSKLNEHD